MKIVRDTDLCHGCGACALACSYHFNKAFSNELGSIKVHTDYSNGNIDWTIDTTCDSCENESEPLCIKYCIYGTLGVVK